MDNTYSENKICTRTLKIIEYLSHANRNATISEISRELGIPKSTTHDLLHTMLQHGFLEFENERLKTFRLGIKLFEIGSSILGRNSLQKEARTILEKVRDECEGTVFIVIEDKGQIVYLDKLEGNASVITTAQLGSRKEMYCTGLGKAMLSTYSDEEVRKWARDKVFERKTKHTLTSVDDLIRQLQLTRERGYAIDEGEDDPHLLCVAAPVYGRNGKAVAAVSIAALAFRMDDEKLEKNKSLILQAANEITRRIGGKR